MTQLLEKAYKEAKKASSEVQDCIASLILAELDDEAAWQKSFEATSDEQWDLLANMAREEMSP